MATGSVCTLSSTLWVSRCLVVPADIIPVHRSGSYTPGSQPGAFQLVDDRSQSCQQHRYHLAHPERYHRAAGASSLLPSNLRTRPKPRSSSRRTTTSSISPSMCSSRRASRRSHRPRRNRNCNKHISYWSESRPLNAPAPLYLHRINPIIVWHHNIPGS